LFIPGSLACDLIPVFVATSFLEEEVANIMLAGSKANGEEASGTA
jgi:hypothetical protein